MLDIKVDARVCAEARHVVHLEHPRFQLVVEHNVEAEKVTARVRLLCLARAVQVLQLRLDYHHSLDNDLLNLMPNLIRLFPVGAPVRARGDEFALQDVSQTKLVLRAVKVFAVAVKRIVCQMHVRIVKALRRIILLTCEPHEPILIQENAHWRNDGRDKHIDPEVVFVAGVQGRPFNVLLNNVLVFRPLDSTLHNAVHLALRFWIRVLHCRVDALLDLDVFVESLAIALVSLVELDAHFLNFAGDENAAALRARLRLADVEDDRILLRLRLRHLAVIKHFLALVCLLLGIFLNVIEVSRVHPRLRKEIIVLWELLLKSFEMHSEGTFTTNIVHS